MIVNEDTDRTVYTINIPEMVAFRAHCDNEPMCEGWFIVPDIDPEGWTTIRVPNWVGEIHEFYSWIRSHTIQGKAITPKPAWFEDINPVIAEKMGVTPA